MPTPTRLMVDIHCHIVPGIDDGSEDLSESLDMARMAVNDGIGTVICTPHQLGNFARNTGDDVRQAVARLQTELQKARIPLRVLPGADVRIETGMVGGVVAGSVMSLADHKKHVLLELPHELYFPLELVLEELRRADMVGILSHPERNRGILSQPELLPKLVDAGCLMQVTAGSLLGSMGQECKSLSQWMLAHGLVHFFASDAHGVKSRRPVLHRAFNEVARLTDEGTAQDLFVRYPACVAIGKEVPAGRRKIAREKAEQQKADSGWFGWKRAG